MRFLHIFQFRMILIDNRRKGGDIPGPPPIIL